MSLRSRSAAPFQSHTHLSLSLLGIKTSSLSWAFCRTSANREVQNAFLEFPYCRCFGPMLGWGIFFPQGNWHLSRLAAKMHARGPHENAVTSQLATGAKGGILTYSKTISSIVMTYFWSSRCRLVRTKIGQIHGVYVKPMQQKLDLKPHSALNLSKRRETAFENGVSKRN